jgi:predicted  nucleic acid-binding Zn-ribbon protein
MSSLIALDNEYRELMQIIQDGDGEISPEVELALTKNLIESKDKVSGYIVVLDRFESEIEFANEQIKKAKDYVDKIKRQKDRLENIALQVIQSKGARLEGEMGRWISTRKSSSVEITDQDLVPPIFSKVTVSLDKSAIKAAIASGEEVPGARISENLNVTWK